MIVKAESMEYPDFGFEKKMTKTGNSNTLIYRYIDDIIPHQYSSDSYYRERLIQENEIDITNYLINLRSQLPEKLLKMFLKRR